MALHLALDFKQEGVPQIVDHVLENRILDLFVSTNRHRNDELDDLVLHGLIEPTAANNTAYDRNDIQIAKLVLALDHIIAVEVSVFWLPFVRREVPLENLAVLILELDQAAEDFEALLVGVGADLHFPHLEQAQQLPDDFFELDGHEALENLLRFRLDRADGFHQLVELLFAKVPEIRVFQHPIGQTLELPHHAPGNNLPLLLALGDRTPHSRVPVSDVGHDPLREHPHCLELLIIHIFSIPEQLHDLPDFLFLGPDKRQNIPHISE